MSQVRGVSLWGQLILFLFLFLFLFLWEEDGEGQGSDHHESSLATRGRFTNLVRGEHRIGKSVVPQCLGECITCGGVQHLHHGAEEVSIAYANPA